LDLELPRVMILTMLLLSTTKWVIINNSLHLDN
jgi:hypothetical protein